MKITAVFAVIISVILYQYDATRIAALLIPTLQDKSSDQLYEISTAKVKDNSLVGLQFRHQILEHLKDFEKHKKKTADNKLRNYYPVAIESTYEEKEQNENVLDNKGQPNNKNNSRRNESIANFKQLDQTYFTKQNIEKENNKFDKVQTTKQRSLVQVKRYNINVHRDVPKSKLRSRMFQRNTDNQSSQPLRVNSRKNGYHQANHPFVSRSTLSKSRAERNRQLQKVYNSLKRRHGTGPRNHD